MSFSLFFTYFADIFNSSVWTDLRTAVPQGSDVLFSFAVSLPDVALASRAPSTYFSAFNRWNSRARDHGLTAFPASPFHLALYLRYLMSEAKTASPFTALPGCISWVRAFSYGSTVGEKHSFWCAAFTGPPQIQKGANHSLPAITICCLQDRCDGLFVSSSFCCHLFDSFYCIS